MRRVLACAVIGLWACSGPDEPSGTTPAADGDEREMEGGAGSTVEETATTPEPARPLEVVEHDDACQPHDARAEGACDAILGTFWEGSRCVQISGCRCVGEHCDDALGSLQECEELYEHCG